LTAPALARNRAPDSIVVRLNPYSNNALATYRKGDQIIRFAVHQPDTKFSKQRATIPFEGGQGFASFPTSEGGPFGTVEVQAHFGVTAIGSDFGTSAPVNACELYMEHDEIVYLLASAQPGSIVDGLSSFYEFHQDGRDYGTTVATTGMVRQPQDVWAVKIYDLRVINYGTECFSMTAAEFRAWLDQHFPGHDRRGHPGKGNSGALARAAALLGLSIRSVERKRDGKLPITARDEMLIKRSAADPRTGQTPRPALQP
jgi:hypothetical protein